MVFGRGSSRFRTVRLSGHKVRKARGNFSNSGDGVNFSRDCTFALMLELRSRLEAAVDILDGILRGRSSVSRVLELTLRWDHILNIGPIGPATQDDLHSVVDSGLVHARGIVDGLHSR